jgi:hypothetical protein
MKQDTEVNVWIEEKCNGRGLDENRITGSLTTCTPHQIKSERTNDGK